MTRLRGLAQATPVRLALGILVSLAFAAMTLSRVDVQGVANALAHVAPFGLAITLAFVWLEVCIRAWRWAILLSPIATVRYRSSIAYLCIGYFANTLLPVRLGDVVRAYLAGRALGSSRLAVLGTVLVERLIDGGFTVAVALTLGLAVGGGASVAASAEWIGALGVVGTVGMVALILVLRRSRFSGARAVSLLRDASRRLLPGTVALRSVSGIGLIAAATLLGYLSAVGALASVADAVGLHLSAVQAGLAMAAVALATAVPAAPSSIGTYEFVGLTLLTAMGFQPEPALAAVLLLHLIAVLPPSVVGLVLAWAIHLAPDKIAAAHIEGKL